MPPNEFTLSILAILGYWLGLALGTQTLMDFKAQHLGPWASYAQYSQGHCIVTPGTQILNENSGGVQKVLCEF